MGVRRGASALAVGLVAAALARAELPEVARPARAAYAARVEAVREKHRAEVATIRKDSLARLDDAVKAETARGALDAVLSLKAERAWLVRNDPADKAPASKAAQPFRATYEYRLRQARAVFDREARAALGDFLFALDGVVKGETKAGRLESALAVREARKGFEGAGPPEPALPAADPDRAAVAALLPHVEAIQLRPEGPGRAAVKLKAGAAVPAEPFALVGITLRVAGPAYPADFADSTFLPAVRELRALAEVRDEVGRMALSEADLARLVRLPFAAGLKVLQARVELTARTLDSLKALPALGECRLHLNAADDALLLRLPELARLRRLSTTGLGKSGLATSRGLAAFEKLPLEWLMLYGCTPAAARDVGPAVAAMPALTGLQFGASGIDDDGLRVLAGGCRKVDALKLDINPITDAGLAHLPKMAALRRVGLSKTKVTAAGVAGLAAALPKCRIEWDGGAVEPKE